MWSPTEYTLTGSAVADDGDAVLGVGGRNGAGQQQIGG